MASLKVMTSINVMTKHHRWQDMPLSVDIGLLTSEETYPKGVTRKQPMDKGSRIVRMVCRKMSLYF